MDNTGPRHAEANPSQPDVLADFRLFAVVKTWMDEDIIAAIVRNAFTQGAESVFVVDNGSTDATVERAEEAGAIIAEVFDTPAFDGPLAQVLMNAVVARESLRSGADHVWWLYLDSDEFPEGPDGTSLIEYLATLDRRFRVVGSACFNHLPNEKPEYLAGFHPIDFQPLYFEFRPSVDADVRTTISLEAPSAAVRSRRQLHSQPGRVALGDLPTAISWSPKGASSPITSNIVTKTSPGPSCSSPVGPVLAAPPSTAQIEWTASVVDSGLSMPCTHNVGTTWRSRSTGRSPHWIRLAPGLPWTAFGAGTR